MFRALAQARLAALRSPGGARSGGHARERGRAAGGPPALGFPAGLLRPSTQRRAAMRVAVPRVPGSFPGCAECPEMVVLAGCNLSIGRYEVTVVEYRAFPSATGGGAGEGG